MARSFTQFFPLAPTWECRKEIEGMMAIVVKGDALKKDDVSA